MPILILALSDAILLRNFLSYPPSLPTFLAMLDISSKLNWKTLKERRNEQQLKCVSKALACQCPENISNMFTMSNSERHDLRSNNSKLVLAKPKTNFLKRIFRYAAAKVWNQSVS